MENHGEIKKDTQLLFPTSAKKTKRGKECAASGCSNVFYNSGTATGLFIFFKAYFIALRDKLVVYPDKEA